MKSIHTLCSSLNDIQGFRTNLEWKKAIKYTKISGKQDKMHHGFATIRSWKSKVVLLLDKYWMSQTKGAEDFGSTGALWCYSEND